MQPQPKTSRLNRSPLLQAMREQLKGKKLDPILAPSPFVRELTRVRPA